jgi:3-deoxy-D-manno-octulosonate 8-phosphate phosphatase (KDO 8-P phosphatase)
MNNIKYVIFKFVFMFKLRSKDKIALVSDVDGVLTDGKFHYSDQGKILKVFGSHDADALKLLAINKRVAIFFLTADARGFEISSKRITDMGFEVQLMNPSERVNFISKLKREYFTIYVGDSFTDIDSMRISDFAVVPNNAHQKARKNANLITKSNSAEGAMSEICLIMMKSLNK